ncbi:hypothetical protein ACTTBA_01670 [Shewanella frigidimarina]|uniref:hypothetical protein n=1 Tax=Shewanella frigidimarina TaxID=56812 RepID=UPI003FA08A13
MESNIILSLIISIIFVYVAIQQMVTNRNKLKLDLFNKRFEIYSSALTFVQEVTSNIYSAETHRDFISKKESAYFLFSNNQNIYKLLDEMHSKSFIIKGFRETAEQLRNTPESFIKYQKDHEAALSFFINVMPKLRLEMKNHLEFK